MSEKKPICLAPWSHQNLTSLGKFKLCCLYSKNFDAPSFKDAWNHADIKQARLDLLDGKFPDGCDNCSVPGKSSSVNAYFNRFNRYFKSVADISANTGPDGSYPWEPLSLDVRNHHCNLKCRTCSPANSTSIANENKSLKIMKIELKYGEAYNIDNLHEFSDEQFQQIKDIYWAGGEPFMSPLHWNVMERLLEIGKTDIDINYNTNGTFPGKTLDRAIKLLSNFKKVSIKLSLDGVGEIGEYIRDGLKFDEFESNLQRLRIGLPNADYFIDVTLTSIGLVNLPDLIRWCDSIGISPNISKVLINDTRVYLDMDILKPEVFLDLIAKSRVATKSTTNIDKNRVLNSLTYFEKYYKPVIFDRSVLARIEKQRGKVGFFDSIMNGIVNE